MNIQERLSECNQKFEAKKNEQEQHLKAAEEALIEMHQLQGEYRVLQELNAEADSKNQKKAKDEEVKQDLQKAVV